MSKKTDTPAFRLLINEKNVDILQLPKSTQALISDYENIAAAVAETLAKKESEGIDEDEEQELADWQKQMVPIDKSITKKVNHWLKNPELYRKRAEQMAKGREQRKNKTADTTPAETTPADTTPADTTPADTTPADTTPADTTPADTPPAPKKKNDDPEYVETEEVPVEEKKENNGLLWGIATVVGIGILAFFGIRQMKK